MANFYCKLSAFTKKDCDGNCSACSHSGKREISKATPSTTYVPSHVIGTFVKADGSVSSI